MKKRIEFLPAFDKRDPDPNKNCGIHGVDISFYLIGEKGAVQFVIYTNWQLPSVQKEIDEKPPKSEYPYLYHQPMAADLGYHSYKPTYEGQEPLTEDCHLLKGKCYYDGSSLNAERVFDVLRTEGSDGVWRELEAFYSDVFTGEVA